jgi:hypothetical protein
MLLFPVIKSSIFCFMNSASNFDVKACTISQSDLSFLWGCAPDLYLGFCGMVDDVYYVFVMILLWEICVDF